MESKFVLNYFVFIFVFVFLGAALNEQEIIKCEDNCLETFHRFVKDQDYEILKKNYKHCLSICEKALL